MPILWQRFNVGGGLKYDRDRKRGEAWGVVVVRSKRSCKRESDERRTVRTPGVGAPCPEPGIGEKWIPSKAPLHDEIWSF